MLRCVVVFVLFWLNAGGVLLAQKGAADPTQRYFRLICLVHLTGSGKAGDPIVPEYVVAGTAAAQAGMATSTAVPPTAAAGGGAAGATGQPSASVSVSAAPMASRPGFIAWSMLPSDDGKMAIIHIVAADSHAFDAILADTRSEIRVFQIGKDSKATIEAAMKQYRKSFSLDSFEVMAQ